jgi:hypothetical protein
MMVRMKLKRVSQLITFISRLMHSNTRKLDVKIYVVVLNLSHGTHTPQVQNYAAKHRPSTR